MIFRQHWLHNFFLCSKYKGMPFDGRRMISGVRFLSNSFLSIAGLMLKCLRMVEITTFCSITANFCPRQFLAPRGYFIKNYFSNLDLTFKLDHTPAEKGTYAYALLFAASSGKKRSGSNVSGSGKSSGLRCWPCINNTISVWAGMTWF